MSNRIYVVSKGTDFVALVRASHPQQAVNHVVKDQFAAGVASQDDLVALLAKGVKVQDAKPFALEAQPVAAS